MPHLGLVPLVVNANLECFVHFFRGLWLLSSASGGTLKGWPANYQDLPLAKTPSLLATESLKASREDQLIQAAPHSCQRGSRAVRKLDLTRSHASEMLLIYSFGSGCHANGPGRQAGCGRLNLPGCQLYHATVLLYATRAVLPCDWMLLLLLKLDQTNTHDRIVHSDTAGNKNKSNVDL